LQGKAKPIIFDAQGKTEGSEYTMFYLVMPVLRPAFAILRYIFEDKNTQDERRRAGERLLVSLSNCQDERNLHDGN
jgi:hypothetical protein